MRAIGNAGIDDALSGGAAHLRNISKQGAVVATAPTVVNISRHFALVASARIAATDEVLGVRVALKTVRPEIANDSRVSERFRRETYFARQVTHPNVCRIFDVGFHALPSGERITFLSMEFLEGETLSARIARGRLPMSAALPLAEQMASALDAAHRAGVVHRDFKSPNVMLVDADGATRAVVTDFGLARGALPRDHFSSMTESGKLLGSPAYMAPEQVAGYEVGRPADIYAFGIVLYEMVAGRLPFVGDTPMLTALKRLQEAPPSPRKFAADLDENWARTILRCLEREPERRPQSAEEVVAALRTVGAVSVTDELIPRLQPSRRSIGAFLAALVALSVTLLVFLRRAPQPMARPAAAPVATPAPPAVPVVVRIHLSAAPPAATLFLDDKTILNPFELTVAKSELQHFVKARLDGYEPSSLLATFDHDQQLNLVLAPVKPPTPSVRPIARVHASAKKKAKNPAKAQTADPLIVDYPR